MKKYILAVLICLCLVGCGGDNPRKRGNAKEDDYIITTIHHEGCEYVIFKQADGYGIYHTVGIVHNPKCKACK